MLMPQEFVPRDWQDRFVREYQTNTIKNFLLEGCTSAGKTGGAIYAYVSLKDGLDWRFLISVVPSEHLRRQYAQDAASLFGLNLYYSGTSARLGRLPSVEELLKDNYHGMVLSYQWLVANNNAEVLNRSLKGNIAGKIFLILDEVHHASSELAFGQACEAAFPDDIVSHRLMTSGTPFRSDNNRILGNWVNYQLVGEDIYECIPNFRYTLADALSEEVIPAFSFVTMAGEFKYRRGGYEYEGITFSKADHSEQELTDALNTAIYVDGDWVKEAIKWAHERVKRDRAKGIHECAVYVRVPTIKAAQKMRERIRRLTNEEPLVVVSKDDDPGSNFSQKKDPSKLIEEFAAETGHSAKSWIIGVGMLGEGVSIKRLKYRIHATNIRASLSFMQDLGRLLRKFPEDNPEPVETLIPAHPDLIRLAIDAMNEVAHVINEGEEDAQSDNEEIEEGDGDGETIPSSFQPLASTGELASQIVDGEEISDEYTSVAEWAVANKEIWRHWGKTPAHLAQMLQGDRALFELLRQEFLGNSTSNSVTESPAEKVPDGFPSEYATWLLDEKKKYASSQAHKKAQRLAYILYPDGKKGKIAEAIKEIHTVSKRRCNLSISGHIGYQGWEEIYLWLMGRIAEAHKIKGTEDL